MPIKTDISPSAALLSEYLVNNHGADAGSIKVKKIGKGSHGQGFSFSFTKDGEAKRLIIKNLGSGTGLGHDYPSDRAAVFLQAFETYGRLPLHVKAVDVLSVKKGGEVIPFGGGNEYYLVMEEASGTNYFSDLREMADKASLSRTDKGRIKALAAYLARIHAKKKNSVQIYRRKVRDTIGHGECLMGVLDTYQNGAGFTTPEEMASIEKACIDWRTRLKPLHARLSITHGDFHPGNILFLGDGSFQLLDRSRGEYGEPADDVTALTINYIFFSLLNYGKLAGAYDEAIRLFFDEYAAKTGDCGLPGVVALYYAFRGVVVANPLFYPDVADDVRGKIFAFIHGVLMRDEFDPSNINRYIAAGLKYRERFH